jgi:hypothetical protein
MKHSLLILISLLLLSSPVIGDNHKGETLYRWENPSGDGYVWKKSGEKETHPKYKGEVKDRKPNGLGVIIYSDGSMYVGRWKNGIRDGQGSQIHKGGGKYSGSWKNGSWWNGKQIDPNGNIIRMVVNGKIIK